jgi:hypothetical protein
MCKDLRPKPRGFEHLLIKPVLFLQASDFKDPLAWDKDDEAAMDFVAACSNIRAHVSQGTMLLMGK